MIANMKKRQSTLISVVDAVFRKIRNGQLHGTTMCSGHTGESDIGWRITKRQLGSSFSLYVVHKVGGIQTKKKLRHPGM